MREDVRNERGGDGRIQWIRFQIERIARHLHCRVEYSHMDASRDVAVLQTDRDGHHHGKRVLAQPRRWNRSREGIVRESHAKARELSHG